MDSVHTNVATSSFIAQISSILQRQKTTKTNSKKNIRVLNVFRHDSSSHFSSQRSTLVFASDYSSSVFKIRSLRIWTRKVSLLRRYIVSRLPKEKAIELKLFLIRWNYFARLYRATHFRLPLSFMHIKSSLGFWETSYELTRVWIIMREPSILSRSHWVTKLYCGNVCMNHSKDWAP